MKFLSVLLLAVVLGLLTPAVSEARCRGCRRVGRHPVAQMLSAPVRGVRFILCGHGGRGAGTGQGCSAGGCAGGVCTAP